jgi:hypothetical protein
MFGTKRGYKMFEIIRVIKDFRSFLDTMDLSVEEKEIIKSHHFKYFDLTFRKNFIQIEDLIYDSIDYVTDIEYEYNNEIYFREIIRCFNKLLFLCPKDIYISSDDQSVFP